MYERIRNQSEIDRPEAKDLWLGRIKIGDCFLITQQDLTLLAEAALKAGYELSINQLKLVIWDAGFDTHIPTLLPNGFGAVYIFEWGNEYLKVGKVNANSNPRYQFHHYNETSSRSNLSKSLLNDTEFDDLLDGISPGDWIKNNTTRYNILIPSILGKNFINFAEAFFILKCNPRFEDRRL